MRHIFTRIKTRMFILLSVISTLSYAQTGNLTGVVLGEKNDGLIGATIKLKGTSTGAACDLDGKFLITNIPIGEQTFVVSYIGYTPKELIINIKEGENIQPAIILKEDKLLLNEVVVVGYGTQVRHDMSSSSSTIKASDLQDKPVDNFASALAGQAAGVQVTTDNGTAGSSATIRIRGTHTLSNSADPLYVIDGVPIVAFDISNSGNNGYNTSPLASINPNDIESEEILKDAAATAIYGARGANGVVIITTKSGKDGKSKIDFSYTAGISTPAHVIGLLDGKQYAQLYQEAYRNDSIAGVSGRQNFKTRFGFSPDSAANTNWLNQVLRTGYYQDANVSASGGNAKTTFFTALGIRDEKTFLKSNSFQRASLRVNVNHVASKYFDFGANLSLTRSENHYVNTSYSGGIGAAQSSWLPIYPVYNHDGTYYSGPGTNPLAQINLDKQQNVSWRTIDNVYANIHFLKNFTFHNEFGIDMIDQIEEFYYPTEVTHAAAEATDRRDMYFTYNYTGSLDYKKDFSGKHSFEALVGTNVTATIEKFSYIDAIGFSNPSFTQVQSADSIRTATAGTGRQFNFASFFGRLNYKYKDRYLFQFSFRADGSSRFAPANRFGYFPAGSIGWVASEEDFFKKQKALSFLKIRASSGLVGNAEFSNDWAYYSTFSSGQNYAGQGGIAPTQTSVTNLTWESTLKNDVGIDFAFFESKRLSGLFDFYYESTSNILVQAYPLSPSSGYSTVSLNKGATRNYGIELQLTSYNLPNKSKFQWKTTLNFALNRNMVTDLGGVAQVFGTGPNRNRAIVGQPIGVYWLAQYAGVDPATGNPLIYDFSGHKVAATATSVETYAKATGRPYPLFQGGLTNTFSYKGIELNILLTYSYGNQIYDDGGKYQSYTLSNYFNQTTDILARWQKAGDVTNIPKLSTVNYNNLNTTLFLHDASYMKIKNITLAYNLPSKVLTKMKMRAFRIFISAQNLATATAYKGWDPEYNRDNSSAITQGATYLGTPQARTYSIGFNFGL